MIPFEAFSTIKKGDVIIFRNGRSREAQSDVMNRCVTLKKIHGVGDTVYTYSDLYKNIVAIARVKGSTKSLHFSAVRNTLSFISPKVKDMVASYQVWKYLLSLILVHLLHQHKGNYIHRKDIIKAINQIRNDIPEKLIDKILNALVECKYVEIKSSKYAKVNVYYKMSDWYALKLDSSKKSNVK